MTTYLGTATGTTAGIQGDSTISSANGVKGTSSTGASAIYGTSSGAGPGVTGSSTNTAGYALYGKSVYGAGPGGYGAFCRGIQGGVYAIGQGIGASAQCSTSGGYAAIGYAVSTTGAVVGIKGSVVGGTASDYGVYGTASGSAYAGYFDGALYATTATSSIKAFEIDHPLDPENRILRHASVESPEMKNLYDGEEVANDDGEFVVGLPAYFEALNENIRYQLTGRGGSSHGLYVKQKLQASKFVVAGAQPGQRVSWQVTGTRKDAFAKTMPIPVEEDKPVKHRGRFLNPESHGQPSSKGVTHEIRDFQAALPTPLHSA